MANWVIFWGGAKYLFGGRNVHQGLEVGFGVQKWVKVGQNPLSYPLWTHFGTSTKTHFRQGGTCSLKRALRHP